jgi:sarcosine oxidase subunit alpha
MSASYRLAADAAHQFGGIELDRGRPLTFRLNGRRLTAFAGDTVLSAMLAAGIDTYGVLSKTPLALSHRFSPLVAQRRGDVLPMDRLLVSDGLDLTSVGRRLFGVARRSVGHRIDGVADAPWLRAAPDEALSTDVLIVGGGVAGLAAADAAAQAGHTVILAERRPWLGGDARYFGPVGDQASPEAVCSDLIARVSAHPNVTVLTAAEVFSLQGSSARLHRIVGGRGRVVAITARRIVIATGSLQRLPLFGGNRLPGVVSAIDAYHLAKRYGLAPGRTAVVATQSNYGYRLALRLHDAGVAIRRIVDPRVNPQSRFVDFAKASGLNLAGGQSPLSALPQRNGLHLSFATIGTTTASLSLEAEALIVSGPFYPELSLWMMSGGGTQWRAGRLEARGHVEHVALAGSAAGYRTLAACVASGRAAMGELFGGTTTSIEDEEIGAPYETPEATTMIGPVVSGLPTFFDAGTSLIVRPDPTIKPMLVGHAQAPSLGDVAASVDVGATSPADAGAVAEERGAPGGDLAASTWAPPPSPESVDGYPTWLAGRFGKDTAEIHLIVDVKQVFARGALVYANTARPDPSSALGVIVRDKPGGAGGIALVSNEALRKVDRFVVETLDGPCPARIKRD